MDDMDWIKLDQNKVHWRAVVKAIMNLVVFKEIWGYGGRDSEGYSRIRCDTEESGRMLLRNMIAIYQTRRSYMPEDTSLQPLTCIVRACEQSSVS
jgi:hypothetical protein